MPPLLKHNKENQTWELAQEIYAQYPMEVLEQLYKTFGNITNLDECDKDGEWYDFQIWYNDVCVVMPIQWEAFLRDLEPFYLTFIDGYIDEPVTHPDEPQRSYKVVPSDSFDSILDWWREEYGTGFQFIKHLNEWIRKCAR